MAAISSQLASGQQPPVSRLFAMQARFRDNIMLEKQNRLLQMAARQDAEREDIIHRVTRTSGNSSLSSSMSSLNSSGAGQGRVRRMFEERRHNPRGYGSPKGFDKGNPLEPIRKENIRGVIKPRGISEDRTQRGPGHDDSHSTNSRSRSIASTQRTNRGPPREAFGVRQPKQNARNPTSQYHKSTSSLTEPKDNRYRTNNKTYQASPPSSTKSSPGHGGPPVAPRRSSYPTRPPPRKASSFDHAENRDPYGSSELNGNYNDDENRPPPRAKPLAQPPPRGPPKKAFQIKPRVDRLSVPNESSEGRRSKSPSRSPRASPTRSRSPEESGGGGGFLSKLGFGGNKKSQSSKPPPAAAKSTKTTPRPTPRPGPVDPNLVECKICNRRFASDRITKHQEICARSKQKAKKRKVMDPTVLRTRGTEAEQYVKKGAHLKEPKKKKPHDWRKQHEEFIATIRAAKGIKGYVAPPVDISDYTKCPHCGRNFAEAAADRHIPKCANIQSNKSKNSRPTQGFRR